MITLWFAASRSLETVVILVFLAGQVLSLWFCDQSTVLVPFASAEMLATQSFIFPLVGNGFIRVSAIAKTSLTPPAPVAVMSLFCAIRSPMAEAVRTAWRSAIIAWVN